MIKKSFTTKLAKDDDSGWVYVRTPFNGREVFGQTGYIKAKAKIDSFVHEAKLLPYGDGTYVLPVKAKIRKEIGKEAGDSVEIDLEVQ